VFLVHRDVRAEERIDPLRLGDAVDHAVEFVERLLGDIGNHMTARMLVHDGIAQIGELAQVAFTSPHRCVHRGGFPDQTAKWRFTPGVRLLTQELLQLVESVEKLLRSVHTVPDTKRSVRSRVRSTYLVRLLKSEDRN